MTAGDLTPEEVEAIAVAVVEHLKPVARRSHWYRHRRW
jgi:hypothetical protein